MSLLNQWREWKKRIGWSRFAQLVAQQGREEKYVQEFAKRMRAGLLDGDAIQIGTDNLVSKVWQTHSGDLHQFNQRFFEDLYDMLSQCGNDVGKATQLLQSLQKSLSELPRGTHVPEIIEFCQNLAKLVEGGDLLETIRKQLDTLESLSNRKRVVDALYVYDFYRRVEQFFEEVDQGKDPWVAIPPRDYGSSYSPMAIELAHAVLDNLRSADKPPVAYLWRFLEGRQTLQKLPLAELSLPERAVCESIIERTRQLIDIPRRLVFDLSINHADYDSLRLIATNAGTQPLRGIDFDISPLCVRGSHKLTLEALEESPPRELTIDRTRSEPVFTVQIDSRYGKNSWKLAYGREHRPYPMVEISDEPRTVYRRQLLEELWKPLRCSESGSVRFLCGIPRVGKTTLLQDFRRELTQQQDSCLVSYLDLQLILPVWPKPTPGLFDGSEIRRFLRSVMADLDPDYDPQVSRNLDQMLDEFTESLVNKAQGKQIVVLLDEFSWLARSLEKTDPLLLEKILDTLGPRIKGGYSQLPIHYIICGAEDLTSYIRSNLQGYPLLSSAEPLPILVSGLSRGESAESDEIKTLLEKPFHKGEGQIPIDRDHLWFDDLALDMVEAYTGGHPLLVQLISRTVSELVQVGKIAVPIGGPEIYQLLFLPAQEQWHDKILWGAISELRDALAWTANVIWENLAEDTRKRLGEVLNLQTMNGVNELVKLGLLKIASNGMPRMRIELLERMTKIS